MSKSGSGFSQPKHMASISAASRQVFLRATMVSGILDAPTLMIGFSASAFFKSHDPRSRRKVALPEKYFSCHCPIKQLLIQSRRERAGLVVLEDTILASVVGLSKSDGVGGLTVGKGVWALREVLFCFVPRKCETESSRFKTRILNTPATAGWHRLLFRHWAGRQRPMRRWRARPEARRCPARPPAHPETGSTAA